VDVRKIKLLSGRIMVEPDEPLAMTRGGIVLPDQAKEKPRHGTAVAVSATPHRFDSGAELAIEVRPGDRVLYGRYGGVEWKDPDTGREYVILTQQEIFAVLPG